MDNKLEIFHADLFIHDNVGTDYQVADLKDQVLSAKEKNSGVIPNSNDNCWRSVHQYDRIDWLYNAVKELTKAASEYYFETDKFFSNNLIQRKIDIKLWTNVNEPGGANVLHNHEKDSYAAVYYVDAEDTGCLSFLNPANLLSNCNPLSPMTRQLVYPPVNNQLILWPAWVPHEVEINKSDKQRINLAFSIRVS